MRGSIKNRPKILLVDDNPQGLIALETVLSDCDYNLISVSSGKEALNYLLKNEVAVILMDVQMPEMNGFETAAYIKKRERTRSIPIIFVTGIDKDERFVSDGYESGAVDYIFKPFDAKILRSKVAVFVDLYEQIRKIRIQTEQLELESRTRYKNLADAIPHIVWMAQPDFSVDYFNKTWTSYTGLTLEQSCGFGWKSVFAPEDLSVLMSTWKKAKQQIAGFEVEARIFHAGDGAYRWHLIRGVVERTSASSIDSWLITCTEIHNLKEAETQLLKTKLEADKANKAKTFFLANMSHEIRTPLNAILGFSDLLLRKKISYSERISHAGTIKRNGEQLLELIEEILDISKIESGSLYVSKEKIFLRDLITSVEDSVTIQAAKKGLSIKFESSGNFPEYIYTDPIRARQILINIIGNAVKFTTKGLITISVSYDSLARTVCFSIKDTGPGIDIQHIDSLFRPFSQGDASTSRKFGGTGLGLALSRKLTRALGGDLVLVETKPGKGSTFTASFSTGTEDSIPLIDTLKLESSPQKSTSQASSRNELKDINVLVADDQVDNQLLFTTLLQQAGAKVDIAKDGVEAIRKALKGNYHLVLMDIQMPKVNGYEATQALRDKGYSKPILAVTAHAMLEDKERCLSVGCSGYIAKPIQPRNFVETVAEYVV